MKISYIFFVIHIIFFFKSDCLTITTYGAIQSTNGIHTIYTYPSPGGTFIASESVSADVLIVGGGGCGGGSPERQGDVREGGGGGGAGKLGEGTLKLGGLCNIVVGNGGTVGQNGEDSSITCPANSDNNYLRIYEVAKGGGSGGFGHSGSNVGGSGGGGSGYFGIRPGGPATPNPSTYLRYHGNGGGMGRTHSNGGGGGGAGSPGQMDGSGGSGFLWQINGKTYAGGGGGGAGDCQNNINFNAGTMSGGSGIGGNGASSGKGFDASPGTGSGGGGNRCFYYNDYGGSGSDGVIIIAVLTTLLSTPDYIPSPAPLLNFLPSFSPSVASTINLPTPSPSTLSSRSPLEGPPTAVPPSSAGLIPYPTFNNIASPKICQYGHYCRLDSDCVKGNKCVLSKDKQFSQCVPNYDYTTTTLWPWGTACIGNHDFRYACDESTECCDPGAYCNNDFLRQCVQPTPPFCINPSMFSPLTAAPTPPSIPAFPPFLLPLLLISTLILLGIFIMLIVADRSDNESANRVRVSREDAILEISRQVRNMGLNGADQIATRIIERGYIRPIRMEDNSLDYKFIQALSFQKYRESFRIALTHRGHVSGYHLRNPKCSIYPHWYSIFRVNCTEINGLHEQVKYFKVELRTQSFSEFSRDERGIIQSWSANHANTRDFYSVPILKDMTLNSVRNKPFIEVNPPVEFMEVALTFLFDVQHLYKPYGVFTNNCQVYQDYNLRECGIIVPSATSEDTLLMTTDVTAYGEGRPVIIEHDQRSLFEIVVTYLYCKKVLTLTVFLVVIWLGSGIFLLCSFA